MDYNKNRQFKTEVTLRITGLALSIFLLAYLVIDRQMSITVILVLGLTVIQAIALVGFIDKIQRDISMIFRELREKGFGNAKPYTGDETGLTAELRRDLTNMVIEASGAKEKRQNRYNYLRTIVQHAGIGLITFDDQDKIHIYNNAARKIFKIQRLRTLDELKDISPDMVEQFKNLKTGGRGLVTIEIEDEAIRLAIFVIELEIEGKPFKLVSIQNIRLELEQNEMEAWQKLVQVLTHEIMNSVTPISSLTNTVEQEIRHHLQSVEALEENSGKVMEQEDLEDIHMAVQTIHRRSESLIRFVNDFRSMTHIPKPNLQLVDLGELMEQIRMLLAHDISEANIDISVDVVPTPLTAHVDPGQLQQVLINLVQNAIDSLAEVKEPKIWMTAKQDLQGNTFISVKDNGKGIDEEALEKIFIPFFTTKKNGSGIGLSLSQQIIRQHLGSISVKSKIDIGTEFLIKL
ncbi:histidine kinase [Fulvitalea axinellae]|uniref:histidine kinase n=1 Tax=Fulvitalea axinellae TaxID=1182444 RepID=A0AAU9CEE0_9BACT|nr:histidine kinase [Fulvitalea axinellae]